MKQQNMEGKRLKGLVGKMTSCNIKDGALINHIQYFAYRKILYFLEFSIKYVKLISFFLCNCDTVMAKTTVIPSFTFVVQPFLTFPENMQDKCCFVVFA